MKKGNDGEQGIYSNGIQRHVSAIQYPGDNGVIYSAFIGYKEPLTKEYMYLKEIYTFYHKRKGERLYSYTNLACLIRLNYMYTLLSATRVQDFL